MKFAAVTYGTEGDVRPLAAVCRALLDAGHEAQLLADTSTLGCALRLGVPTVPLSGDIKGELQPGGGIAAVVSGGAGVADTAKALSRIANSNAEEWLRTTVEAAAGSDAIIVSGLTAFVGLSAAEHLGTTAIGAGLIPITPTSAFPSPFLSSMRIPRALNRTSHRFVNAMLWRAFRGATNAARKRVCGLPARRSIWTEHPMLYGISPALVPAPSDWPVHARVCGQWLTTSPGWSPPEDLRKFLDAGEPPLYVGFGSMVGFDRLRVRNAVVEAVAGRRTLFNAGWSGVDTAGFPENILVIGETPHDWLFPRTSLVVHHGGSGTSHPAARAGVPSVPVPFAADQFFWARRLRTSGVAADPVDGRKLRADSLARGIAQAEQADTRARARVFGEQMAKERGTVAAVHAIETLASS